MNKRSLKLLGLTSLLFSLCSIPVLANKKDVVEVDAVTDAVKAEVQKLNGPAYDLYKGTYYDGITAKKGKALRDQLHNLILPHTNVGYKGLYTVYLDSDLRPDGTIWDTYADWDFRPSDNTGNYSKVGDMYNREHSIPKSWWGGGENEMYSDAFHLIPTDGYVNNWRGNLPLGEVTSYANNKKWVFNKYVEGVAGTGTSDTSTGISGSVFEPADCYKGDLARNYFYFITTYYHNNVYQAESGQTFSSTTKDTDKLFGFTQASRNLFLKWHHDDPVSQKEVNRCEGVFKHQKNRNPFIDHPEMVDAIWGDGEYNPGGGGTITPVTAPTIDIYTQVGGSAVTKLEGDSIQITVGNTVNVLPYVSGQRDDTVTHTVNGNGAITQSNTCYGYHPVIKGLSEGTGTVTFTKQYDDNGTTKSVSKSVDIMVKSSGGGTTTKALTSLEKSGSLANTTYRVGEQFDPTGLTVTATFSDGSTADVTSSVVWNVNTSTAGTKTVTGSYTFEGVTKTVTVTITVINQPSPSKTLVDVEVDGQCETVYKVGDQFDPHGLTFTAKFSDGSEEDVTDQISWTAYMSNVGESVAIWEYSYGTDLRSGEIEITINAVVPPIIDDDDDDDDPPVIDDDDDDDPPALDHDDDDKPNSIIDMLPGLGCLGSVTSTSIVIFITAILGICLVCLRKKKTN